MRAAMLIDILPLWCVAPLAGALRAGGSGGASSGSMWGSLWSRRPSWARGPPLCSRGWIVDVTMAGRNEKKKLSARGLSIAQRSKLAKKSPK